MVIHGEKRVYRINLAKGILTVEDGGAVRTHDQDQSTMYHFENKVFLDMVATGDWSKNPSDYEDGMKSLELTLLCDTAVSG
jgi:hypothetical protein